MSSPRRLQIGTFLCAAGVLLIILAHVVLPRLLPERFEYLYVFAPHVVGTDLPLPDSTLWKDYRRQFVRCLEAQQRRSVDE